MNIDKFIPFAFLLIGMELILLWDGAIEFGGVALMLLAYEIKRCK